MAAFKDARYFSGVRVYNCFSGKLSKNSRKHHLKVYWFFSCILSSLSFFYILEQSLQGILKISYVIIDVI